MLKKLLLGVAAAALLASQAFAANLPLFITNNFDPINELGNFNSTLLAINQGVNGNLAVLPGQVTSSGTAIQPLLTYTAPGGQLNAVGQAIYIRGWGINSGDANAKTVTFTYGASVSCALAVTGSGNTWAVEATIVKTGTATQNYECHGQTGTAVLASVQGSGTNADASPTTVTISVTPATAGTMALVGGIVGQLK